MTNQFHLPLFAAALAALTLAGCAREPTDYRVARLSSNYGLSQATLASAVPISNAAAQLPPSAGQVIQVSERRYADGISQQIVMAGDRSSHGENRIDIAMRTRPLGDQSQDNLLPLQKPTDGEIASELESRFPGMQMEMVNVLLQNRYGPYGLAAGRRGTNERCIYAWQWIEDIGVAPSSRYSALGNAILNQPQPASVRIRLCRTGGNADQLASLVEGIAIGGGLGNRQLPVLGQTAGYGNDALTAAGGVGVATGQSFAGYQLPLTAPSVAPTPRQYAAPRQRTRVVYQARDRRRVARRNNVRQQELAQPTLEVAPQAYQPPQQVYQPAPQAYQPSPQAYQLAAPAYQPPARVYQPSPQAYQPNTLQGYPPAQPAYAPRPVASTPPRKLDQSLPPQAYSGPGNNVPQPLRNTPGSDPLYNRPPSPAQPGNGRLLRDPVVLGPGI